jgi:hypothetical protein
MYTTMQNKINPLRPGDRITKNIPRVMVGMKIKLDSYINLMDFLPKYFGSFKGTQQIKLHKFHCKSELNCIQT